MIRTTMTNRERKAPVAFKDMTEAVTSADIEIRRKKVPTRKWSGVNSYTYQVWFKNKKVVYSATEKSACEAWVSQNVR